MTATDRLRPWEKAFLGVLAVVLLAFGVLTEVRSAFLSRRMGDLGCFLRAGWAIRTGGDELYQVTCDNGWHYNYPPMFAILMTPFADPPRGEEPIAAIPYVWSVAIFYIISVVCLAWAVHLLAGALDPDAARFGRRWWSLRVLATLPVAVALGTSMGKGQVNTIVLVALCGWLAETVRGRGVRAGLYLSFAIAVKIVPALLVLLPLVRRDVRSLGGIALGLFVSLVVAPALVLGPAKTIDLSRQFVGYVIAPGLSVGEDSSRSRELTSVNGTDSQTFRALFHNNIHRVSWARPAEADPAVSLAHWTLGALTILLTLWTFRRRTSDADEVIFGGSLLVLMILVSPVSHLHYFAFLVPLAMGIFAKTRGDAVYPPWQTLALVFGCGLVMAAASLPPLKPLCDKGLAILGVFAWWALTVTYFRPSTGSTQILTLPSTTVGQAA